MLKTCYHCAHADFKTAYQDQHHGFAYCRKNQFVKATWIAPQRECDKGRFAPETDPVKLAKRKELFERVAQWEAAEREYWAMVREANHGKA